VQFISLILKIAIQFSVVCDFNISKNLFSDHDKLCTSLKYDNDYDSDDKETVLKIMSYLGL
jgi:hypothetical protein